MVIPSEVANTACQWSNQHDDKSGQENRLLLSIEAKRGANLQGSHFADDFLSWLNTLGDKEGSWAFLLPMQPEVFGMWILNRLLHSLSPKERGSRCPQRRQVVSLMDQ